MSGTTAGGRVGGDRSRRDGRGGRPGWRWILLLSAWIFASGLTRGQELRLPEDFRRPKLVLNGPVGHLAPVSAAVFSPDGKYLITGGDDKMVRVWEFRQGDPRLDRTFRPPINRLGGKITNLAISPVRDPKDGHYWLAVAGDGAIGNGGDILVYRLEGPNDLGTGDLAFVLEQGDPRAPDRGASGGHIGIVYGLAFSPDGSHLASGGIDRTIRIWDIAAASARARRVPPDPKAPGAAEVDVDKPVAVLTGHTGAVYRLAFLDDDRLVSAGGIGDGSVRLWSRKEPGKPPVVAYAPSPQLVRLNDGRNVAINALAKDPGGREVIVGLEDGRLLRFTIEGLRLKAALLNPGEFKQHGAIEGLAFHPDGQWLAVSRLKDYPASSAALPRTECEVMLRSLAAPVQVRPVRLASDVVRALAFSPDRRFLADVGGAAQELAVQDLQAQPIARAAEVDGPGTILWDVGFVPDAPRTPTLAYARNRPVAQEPVLWEGFDFPGRAIVGVARPDQLRRAVTSFDGWTIRADGLSRLVVEKPGANPLTLTLDGAEGRWMSYTFLPPDAGAGHAGLALAIGTQLGTIVIHTIPDGRKTREFLGHAGPVYAVAPSPDGRWLASASADQTVALWTLAGCDVRPALGARLEREPQGTLIVREIATRGFAEQMGLKVGDRITKAYRLEPQGKTELPLDRLDAEIDAIPPSQQVRLTFSLTRDGAPVLLEPQTSRRDYPALSLLAASNREWIVWMPEGYYDTSIAGDDRLLGWHLNKVTIRNNRFDVLPSDFVPMSRYERRLRRQDVIDQLLANGDPVAAVRLAESNPRNEPPPEIRVVDAAGAPIGGELTVQQPDLTLGIEVQGASAERGVASIRVRDNQVAFPQVGALPPPRSMTWPETIRLWPGDNPITIVAEDDLGVEGHREVMVHYRPAVAPPPPTGGRLLIRSVGIPAFKGRSLNIDLADRDAAGLAAFLKNRGESAESSKRAFDSSLIEPVVLDGRVGGEASAARIGQVTEQLKAEARDGKLGAGDTVFLVVESHVLDLGEGPRLLGSDAAPQAIGPAAIDTTKLTDDLRYLTERGCLVLVFLDGIHKHPSLPAEKPLATQRGFVNWVRSLNKAGVAVMVASKDRPSERGQGPLSAFAQAILDSSNVVGAARSDPSPTLFDFQQVVITRTAEKTSRRQNADFYRPTGINPRLIRIFEPQPRPTEELAARAGNR